MYGVLLKFLGELAFRFSADKRREFNAAADEAAEWFARERKFPNASQRPPEKPIAALRRMNSGRKLRRFDFALAEYERATGKENREPAFDGMPKYRDPRAVQDAAGLVLECLKRR